MPAWIAALVLGSALFAAPVPAPGTLHPAVACLGDPSHSYALYLPSSYAETRSWPILIGFSPSGDGTEAVRRFQALAEAEGWIVVGSNNSRNGPLAPAMVAQDTLWTEVNRRYKLDARRAYAFGFSGGARAAMRLALHHPGRFAGVIAMGAFYPGEDLARGRDLAVVLAVGLEDFNYTEMMAAREELRRRDWLAWSLPHPGGHAWAPPEVCARAVAFLKLAAGRQKLAGRWDETPFLEAARKEALDLDRQGETLLALRVWQDVADWASKPLRTEVRAAVDRLEADPRTVAERAREARFEKTREHMAGLRASPEWGPAMADLLEQEGKSVPPEQRHLRRLVADEEAFLWAAGMAALEAKDWANAAKIFRILGVCMPRDAGPPYLAAKALARAGDAEGAMARLAEAVAKGFRDPQAIRDAPAFQGLAGRPDFQRLLAGLAP